MLQLCHSALSIDRICTSRMASEPEAMPNFHLPSPTAVSPSAFNSTFSAQKQSLLHPLTFSSGLNLGEVGALLGVWQIMGQAHVQAMLTIPLRSCLQLFIAA